MVTEPEDFFTSIKLHNILTGSNNAFPQSLEEQLNNRTTKERVIRESQRLRERS
jgi:hypothetical protein